MAKASQATIPKKQITTARLCKQLPLGYKPDDNDVYCGRGRKCSFHVGNQRFREIIVANLHRYVSATTRSEKSTIIYEIVDYIRHLCVTTGHGIGFIKRDHLSGLYYEAGDMIAVSSKVDPAVVSSSTINSISIHTYTFLYLLLLSRLQYRSPFYFL
jgi:hypothetical protein